MQAYPFTIGLETSRVELEFLPRHRDKDIRRGSDR